MSESVHPASPEVREETQQPAASTPSPLWGEGVFSPLSWAAYITWLAVSFDAIDFAHFAAWEVREWSGIAALLSFVALLAWRSLLDRDRRQQALAALLVWMQATMALLATWCLRDGAAGILLIIVAAQLVGMLALWHAIIWLAAFNLVLALIWSQHMAWAHVAIAQLPLLGFQAFAALTGLYAVRTERARDQLAMVNAELMATRELLAEGARAEERLRLSRELHDVAGHKLTALKLNLSSLARSPDSDVPGQLELSQRLASELLEDIRTVVGEMRRHDGVDLGAALAALARSIPGIDIQIDVAPTTRLTAMMHAETLVRCAQEGLTNAVRHGSPRHVRIHCGKKEGRIELTVEDDGRRVNEIRFGNGLCGMRERLEAVGGSLDVRTAAGGGVILTATVPA